MSKAISSLLPSEDVFSTYCTTSASAHKYRNARRASRSMPNETGFSKNRHHQWNTNEEHHWQTSYEAAHTTASRRQPSPVPASSLLAEPYRDISKERSAFSKQNYTGYSQTNAYAECQSESKSAYTMASFRLADVDPNLSADSFCNDRCSDNGYTRNSVVDFGECNTKTDHRHHQSECQRAYDWPIANLALDLDGWKTSKSTDALSGYSKSCLTSTAGRYGPELCTTMGASYQEQRLLQRNGDHNDYLRYEGNGTDLSGYISNAPNDPRSSKSPASRHGKGLVDQRYTRKDNIPLYTIPIVPDFDSKRTGDTDDKKNKDLTPSPQAITIRPPPPAMLADLSDKRSHWKAY